MIYGRFGDPCTIVRVATLDDIRKLDRREPDKQDREALANGSYVVVQFNDAQATGERAHVLYHQAFMRADGGSREITAAIEALPAHNRNLSQHCAVTDDHEHCPRETTLGTQRCVCPCHGLTADDFKVQS